MGAGEVGGAFRRVKGPYVIVGRLFGGVKSLSGDTKSLFVNAKSLLVEVKGFLVRVKRVAFMHKLVMIKYICFNIRIYSQLTGTTCF
jgi:hypothetical protein